MKQNASERNAYVTQTATNTDGMNNRERVRFHYFNRNGLYAAWLLACNRVSAIWHSGIVPGGWLFAYGTFHDIHVNRITDMWNLKRIKTLTLYVAIDLLRKNVDEINAAVDAVLETDIPVCDWCGDDAPTSHLLESGERVCADCFEHHVPDTARGFNPAYVIDLDPWNNPFERCATYDDEDAVYSQECWLDVNEKLYGGKIGGGMCA